MTEMQRIFWESQREAFAINDKRGLRWHPMMIRLALSLHCKSSGGYEFLAQSGVLVLPSTRRLFDYSHFIEAKEGCQGEIISDIKTKMEACGSDEHFSYVNLMFDEMHIRSGLVTSKSTGELIGFTNLIEAEKELEILTKEIEEKAYKPKLAKHVLVYLAQGITSQTVKDVVAVFSTHDLSSVQLYNRTWDVIYHLEDAGIKVISLTCDGAATNRKFFRMHESLDKTSSEIYVTKNLKSGDARPLYFIIDPPHLMKTVRNCLANSFAHRNTRKLWKNNEFLSWQVIEKLFEITKNEKFRDHKLTKAHIKLTSFSCMTVRFATQVLSLSVAKSIESHASKEAFQLLDTSELVKFIRLMNRFFDCLNGKEDHQESTESAGILRNPDLAAYQSLDDPRFTFLEGTFLKYFEDWKTDILNRPGIHSDSEKSRMIISHQSLESLIITVKGFIGATKYMLREAKAPKVNSRTFNQDPIEQYFGKLRRKQGDNKQPPVKSVLDTRLNLHAQSVAALGCSTGNTTVDSQKGLVVDSTPLRSRKKPKKSED